MISDAMFKGLYNTIINKSDLDPSIKYNYNDRYPDGLNFNPQGELHSKILSKLLSRAWISRNALSNRFDSWNTIDNSLSAYIDLSEDEKKLKKKDPRSPVSIVVPITYATLETMKTFMVSAFLSSYPILRYDPQGEEDVIGAALLERVISCHSHRYQLPLSLMGLWRDGFAYNAGVAVPSWQVTYGKKKVRKRGYRFQDQMVSSIFAPMEEFTEDDYVDSILFEGNELINIDPYQLLLDTTVPLHKVQSGAHFGFTIRTNRLNVLEDEAEDPTMFNCRYLKGLDARSVLYESNPNKRDKYEVMKYYDDSIDPVDLTYWYIKLIPEEWGLGSGTFPEKWFFIIAGDRLILKAEPLALNHGQYPVVPCCPDFDSHTLAPISRLEIMDGMQQAVNFLYNSHFANVRRSVNNMFIIDPQVVNQNDFVNPQGGLLIRVRERFWGKGRLDDAMRQFPVSDVTQAHLNADVPNVLAMNEQITGATQNLQGIRRTTSERVSAAEANTIQNNALSRLEATGKIISSMTMDQLAYFFAEHTQQYMASGQYVQITGRYEEDLRAMFPGTDSLYVDPTEINVNYDIHAHDGSIPGSGDPQTMLQLLQIATQNQMIFPNLDATKMLLYIAKMSGAKNFQDFAIASANTGMKVLPIQAIEEGRQSGNLIPLSGQGAQ